MTKERRALWGLVVSFVCVGAVLYNPRIISDTTPGFIISKIVNSFSMDREAQILFVGDIMLTRQVESHMEREGELYPFTYVQEVLKSQDITVGNFEGVVTEEYYPTQPNVLKFSVRKEYLSLLDRVGFDVLSLANNHSFDFGASALTYTRSECLLARLMCVGSPTQVDAHSTKILDVHNHKVGIIALHTLYGLEVDADLEQVLSTLTKQSDVQVAYIHWGDEYELLHNTAQEKLAEQLIDRGIDAVIGHHPHVVQDIAMYKNKPIFYSLGNFIFDQYFSNDVEDGLGVQMTISRKNVAYKLIPFRSEASQPRSMTQDEKSILYQRIFEKVATSTQLDISGGVINAPR